MGSILKLPCTRFVRQVSNGVAMSKYGYNGMMQKNAEAIKSAPWRKATCSPDDVALTVNKVTETDGVWDASTGTWTKKPTFSAYMKEHYDCFKQGGDAVKELATFCGYLGMVAYRFALPTVNPGAIEELRLMVQRDRYLRSGVRIAIEINSSASPSDDWETIRGEKAEMYATPSKHSGSLGVSSWGFLGQNEIPWLLAGRALDGTLTVSADDFAGLAGAATEKYLWVYMSIEDMADFWDLYSSTEERYYSIEGSASLVASCCEFAFSTDAVAPETSDETETVAGAVGAFELVADASRSLDTVDSIGTGSLIAAIVSSPNENSSASTEPSILKAFEDAGTSEDVILDYNLVMTQNKSIPVSQMFKVCSVGHNAWGLDGGLFAAYWSGDRYEDTDQKHYTAADGVLTCNRNARLVVGSKAVVVPWDRKSYTKMAMTLSKRVWLVNASKYADAAFRNDGMPNIRFNVWRSSSTDLHGPFNRAAAACIARKSAFYSAKEVEVGGSKSWSEGLYAGVTVSATAKFVRDFAWDEIAVGEDDGSLYFELEAECNRGDVIFISPKIASVKPVPIYAREAPDNKAGTGACWFFGAKASSSGGTVPDGMAPGGMFIQPANLGVSFN